MQISFEDTRDLYVEMTFAKCVLAKCCNDQGEHHQVMTTIGDHPDLGHVVIVQHGNLSVDLVTGSFPAFNEYQRPSVAAALEDTPEGKVALQKLEAHERLGEEVMLLAETKARAEGVFEVVDRAESDPTRIAA